MSAAPPGHDLADPLELARALIRCPSVTPEDGGALSVLTTALEALGFTCHRLRFAEVDNLYARLGTKGPNFCFAGHTDVVPPGDRAAWSVDPFAAEVRDGILFGRGAADMKGAIAAFVAAVARQARARGSISLLITGDEEGPAVNGTAKVLAWLAARGEKLDACLVGEPTNPTRLGEMIKIGRRGSLNGRLTVVGAQGHTAYPQLADNPIPRLARMLAALAETPLDAGSTHFQPSTLALTTVDVGNKATNVIPAKATAAFNVRFNDLHSARSLTARLRAVLDAIDPAYELEIAVSGESFLTPPGRFTEIVSGAVARICGRQPELSTTGGTSDARFIKDACPVAEFGLVGQTMHKTDEQVRLADLETLTQIYQAIARDFLSTS